MTETTGRVDLAAERAVIGCALLGASRGLLALSDDDFTDYRHQVIAPVLRDMIRHDIKPDPILLADELSRRGRLNGAGGAGGHVYLTSLIASDQAPTTAMASDYARVVRTATRMRMAHDSADWLARISSNEAGAGDLDEALSIHADKLAAIPDALDAATGTESPTIADLFDEVFNTTWLVPGLVGRGERIVVVGAEGLGKSMLATQWACCLAAGLHPFTGDSFGDPLRVLLIDAENSAVQTQSRYRYVGSRVNAMGGAAGWAKRIVRHIRPEGLDLPGRDRGWLMRVASQASPDLIVLGPAYKIMRGNPQLDSDVLALFNVLDEVRVKHDAALLIETHAGHAKDMSTGKRIIRPYGSSVWLRWPEVGIGLARSEMDTGQMRASEIEVGHWRGARDDNRLWPDLLTANKNGGLPWTPTRGNEYRAEWEALEL